MKKEIIKIILRLLIFILIAGLIFFFIFTSSNSKPFIKNIEVNESKRYEDKVVVNVEIGNPFAKFDKATWCLLTTNTEAISNSNDWVQAENGYCSFVVEAGNYKIFVKDKYGNISDTDSKNIEINKILSISLNKDIVYLYLGQEYAIKYDLTKIGNANANVTFESNDKSIVNVDENGKIKAVGFGTSKVTVKTDDNVTKDVLVYVSNLITKPKVDLSKPYIKCKQFSVEENTMLDNILFDRIDDAGYKTRAGVLAAARWLTLEFSYRVHYFYENGRLNNFAPYLKVDGEGRYYHRGLYLNESKFSEISNKFVGPSIWGCDLQNYTDWGPYVTGKYYPNGLDCSGFVTWALLNGGFDIGDIGAGTDNENFDLTDLGEKVNITNSLMSSGKVKAGDLIGLDGHMAILAGWDDKNYYVAESLNTTGGVVMTVVPRNKLVNNSIYKYIILMDNVYKEDGNYTEMW